MRFAESRQRVVNWLQRRDILMVGGYAFKINVRFQPSERVAVRPKSHPT
jgi:hypothetical protein